MKNVIPKSFIRIKKGENNGEISNQKSKNCYNEFSFLYKIIDSDIKHKSHLDLNNGNCRYSDIITYQDNKVNLYSTKNYINASWIHMPLPFNFIATQGPMPHTIEDFWTMCYENNIEIIIMLCNLKENNVEKCADYWNFKNMKYFEVKRLNKSDEEGLVIRPLQLYNKMNKSTLNIIQFQLIYWDDHNALSESNFNKIIKLINSVDKYRKGKPAIVHCSAGVGRTGTFICMYNLYHEITQQIFYDKESNEIVFSLFNLVRKIKEMRILSVENQRQFALLYDFADYLLQKYNTKKNINTK